MKRRRRRRVTWVAGKMTRRKTNQTPDVEGGGGKIPVAS
jgi:hypothetical protein